MYNKTRKQIYCPTDGRFRVRCIYYYIPQKVHVPNRDGATANWLPPRSHPICSRRATEIRS